MSSVPGNNNVNDRDDNNNSNNDDDEDDDNEEEGENNEPNEEGEEIGDEEKEEISLLNNPTLEYKEPTIHVIREVYSSSNAHESFEAELDKALEAKVDYIIIEPTRLGDETGRWITVGNCLHKTAVFSGISSIISGLIWQDRPVFSTPLCAISIFCTGLYTVSWNYDPCVQYQVEKDPKKLAKVPNLNEFSSPIVLAYTPNTSTKYFQRGVTLLASAFCAWQLYKVYK